jgi:carbon storage regulator
MLVLSRQRDETIMIGDNIEVTVVDIRGDKVRLGINAPKEISVHRKEVYDAIRRENRAAAQVKPEDVAGLPKVPRPNASAGPTGGPMGGGHSGSVGPGSGSGPGAMGPSGPRPPARPGEVAPRDDSQRPIGRIEPRPEARKRDQRIEPLPEQRSE